MALNLILLDLFSNIITAILLLPLTKIFEKLLRKIIKTRKASLENRWSIDEHSFENPSLALRILNENVHKAYLELYNN
jgi:Na+/phosphate symporter